MHKMCSHPLPQTTTPIHIWYSNLPNLCSNSWVTTLFTLICLSKLHIFYKVKCHIYYRICEFLNHLTSIKLYYHFLLCFLFKKIIYRFIFDNTGSLLLGGFFYSCSSESYSLLWCERFSLQCSPFVEHRLQGVQPSVFAAFGL